MEAEQLSLIDELEPQIQPRSSKKYKENCLERSERENGIRLGACAGLYRGAVGGLPRRWQRKSDDIILTAQKHRLTAFSGSNVKLYYQKQNAAVRLLGGCMSVQAKIIIWRLKNNDR